MGWSGRSTPDNEQRFRALKAPSTACSSRSMRGKVLLMTSTTGTPMDAAPSKSPPLLKTEAGPWWPRAGADWRSGLQCAAWANGGPGGWAQWVRHIRMQQRAGSLVGPCRCGLVGWRVKVEHVMRLCSWCRREYAVRGTVAVAVPSSAQQWQDD